MSHILFFSCACVVFHIVMKQQWRGVGGGGGEGCSRLGQTLNPPRSSESWKGCHGKHLGIQWSVVNQVLNYCTMCLTWSELELSRIRLLGLSSRPSAV